MASPALSNMNIMQATNVILKFLVATVIKEQVNLIFFI